MLVFDVSLVRVTRDNVCVLKTLSRCISWRFISIVLILKFYAFDFWEMVIKGLKNL